MQIQLDGMDVTVARDATYIDAVRAAYGEGARARLGVRDGGESLPLGAAVRPERAVRTIVYGQEEGWRIYERSLRFVLLIALDAVFPKRRVRFEFSTHMGVYLTVEGVRVTRADAADIKARMRAIVDADAPFTPVHTTREDAIAYFERIGATDRARLLRYRPCERFDMYECMGLRDYFYGIMTPSTGYTPVFDLRARAPGLELVLPDTADPATLRKEREETRLFRLFEQHNAWAAILGCSNAADLNEMIAGRHIREFIRVNEALHEKAISDIADQFVASGARLILIAGPSSSGKTTFANRLLIQLRVLGLKPLKLSLDDYYLDRDSIPREPDGTLDLEKLETLDVELFNAHLAALLTGATVEAPQFDFVAGKRAKSTLSMRAATDQPIVIEGIHALNDRLTYSVRPSDKFRIFVSAITTINLDDHNRIRASDVRLLRRIVRDHQFRGTDPEKTMTMWDSVKRGENKYIFPYQDNADVMFNSTLHYEIAILKRYAYPMLLRVTPDSAYYTRARRLIKFLNYFMAADVEDEIPNNSILREFIGGCCFYREEESCEQ